MCYKDKVGETGSTARGQAPVQTDMCGQNPETITIANMMMTLCSAQVATGSICNIHSLFCNTFTHSTLLWNGLASTYYAYASGSSTCSAVQGMRTGSYTKVVQMELRGAPRSPRSSTNKPRYTGHAVPALRIRGATIRATV